MYNIIKRYCENECTNGLLLLDMPTGTGKTYSVIKYIFDAVQDPSNKQKFFFITTLKKNLPEEDLKLFFESAGKMNLFKEKFLRVEANYESAINGFRPEVIKTIPANIKKTDEYKGLEQYINLVKNLRKENKPGLRSALIAAEDSLRKDVEPRFRKMVQILLADKYNSAEERLQVIKTEKDWQWVAEMYPSVFMRDRQIIFMSMDKFLSMNSTIIEPSSMLYNSNLIENAVIFIDEFDSTKETVLKNIILNGLRDRIDYVELFHAVYSALHTHSFPAALTTSSQKRLSGKYKDSPLQEVLDKTIKIADEIYKSFSLQYSYRTERVVDSAANNFLFQDHRYHSILDGNKTYITAISNSKARINTIRFSNERPESDDGNIQVMLGKIRGFITYFMGTVRILAINYQQLKEDRRSPNEDEFTLEEAIRTVLAEFKLNSTYINYLTTQILVDSHKYKGQIQPSDFDLSFYEKGFRYYDFEDDYTHDMHSKIMMYSFQLTPEKLLLRFCEKAKVMGVSATATLDSVVGNYDISYLREKLQEKYITITEEERKRLKETFEHSVEGYDKVRIHTALIGAAVYSASVWREVTDHQEVADYLFDLVEQACSEDYDKNRYFRIACAFKNFISHQQIQSFLCVLTKHPRENDKTLDLKVLYDLFDIIVKDQSAVFDVRKNTVQLDGEEYDTKKDEIIKRLGNGEKLFVISVYQTIGAGQNLQYPVPDLYRDKIVCINDRAGNGYKDFDAIYLDMPTNLLTQLTPNMAEDDFVRFLFHVEMLQEKAEVSEKEAISWIRKAFRSKSSQSIGNEYVKSLYECRSIILLSTRVIIQAVGRICRTNLKSGDIYIFADSRLVDRIDFDVCRGRLFNHEFTELIDTLKQSNAGTGNEEENTKKFIHEAQLKSNRVNKFITGLLRESWTDDRIMRWKQLREMALTHPTIASEQFDPNGIAYNFYIELPCDGDRIFYIPEDDFNKVQIFFSKKPGASELSAESSKLTSLMRIDFLRRYFEKHGWATTFAPGKYIMSPTLFNNIYRGALGEVVGKALFYRYANVELMDIEDNDLFEKFDYIVPNSSIYVDFKNWHESSYFESDKELSHIAGKARECGGKCIIIANILAEENWAVREKVVDGIKF